jgi:hypothetical protein
VLLLRYRAARLPRPPCFENDDDDANFALSPSTAPTFLLEIFFDFEDEENEDDDALKLEPFA